MNHLNNSCFHAWWDLHNILWAWADITRHILSSNISEKVFGSCTARHHSRILPCSARCLLKVLPSLILRGNVWINQRGAPTCWWNLCSYPGYQMLSWIKGSYGSNYMAHGPCIHEYFWRPEYEYRLGRQVGVPLWVTQTLPLNQSDMFHSQEKCQNTKTSLYQHEIISEKCSDGLIQSCRNQTGLVLYARKSGIG